MLRSLKGVHLAFTGILSRPAREAVRAAGAPGAIVHGGPSAQTTVRGARPAEPAAGRGQGRGLKLMEIKRLREKGHRITLLNEAQFWRLVGRPGRRRAATILLDRMLRSGETRSDG